MAEQESNGPEVPNDASVYQPPESSNASVTIDPSVVPDQVYTVPIVVAIGASAGGLEAFEAFFTNLPTNTNMAFVVVQHLDPHHESLLPTLIQRYTDMSVKQAANDMMVEGNTVYVIPPNTLLAMFNGAL